MPRRFGDAAESEGLAAFAVAASAAEHVPRSIDQVKQERAKAMSGGRRLAAKDRTVDRVVESAALT